MIPQQFVLLAKPSLAVTKTQPARGDTRVINSHQVFDFSKVEFTSTIEFESNIDHVDLDFVMAIRTPLIHTPLKAMALSIHSVSLVASALVFTLIHSVQGEILLLGKRIYMAEVSVHVGINVKVVFVVKLTSGYFLHKSSKS